MKEYKIKNVEKQHMRSLFNPNAMQTTKLKSKDTQCTEMAKHAFIGKMADFYF